ncbi:hypothetical protein QQ045_025345 [Rhodiola kirilowii]
MRGVSWVRQEIIQKRKCEGGLGFKDLAVFNDAMLLKIGWRMINFPELLMSRILVAKYYKGENIFMARLGNSPSHIWRGVMKSLKFLLDGLWWDDRRATYKWKFSSTGLYTVKSGYEVIKSCVDRSRRDAGEQSDKSMIEKFWKKIWSLNVPNKIKIFCWRLYYNSLPDAVNLWKRGINVELQCRLCGYQNETALHVVRDC